MTPNDSYLLGRSEADCVHRARSSPQPRNWPGAQGESCPRRLRLRAGGARIIYYVVIRRGVLNLLDVYAKSVPGAVRVLLAVIAKKPQAVLRALTR